MATPFDPKKIEIYNPNTGTISYAGDQPAPITLTGRKVNIVDQDGKFIGSIDSSEVPLAQQQGYRIETPEEKRINDHLEASKGILGDLQIAGYSGLNEFTLGALDPAVQRLASPESLGIIKGLQRDHKIASGVGSTIGFGALMGVPGGGILKGVSKLGKVAEAGVLGARAAEAGLGLRSLASAARFGVEGAALAAPQAISEATFGDPRAAAEHLLFGLGAGAALGAVTPTIKGAGKYIVNGMGKPFGYQMTEKGLTHDIRNMSENQAVKSMFTTSSKTLQGQVNQLEKEGIKVGRYALDNELTPKVLEDATSFAERTAANKQLTGQEVGKVVDLLGDAKVINKDSFIKRLDDIVEKKYGESAAFANEYKRGKDYINQLDNQLSKFENTPLAQSYEIESSKLATMTDPAQREAQQKLVSSMRDQLILENNNIPLKRIWRDSSELGGKANKSNRAKEGDPDEISELLNDIRGEIKDVIKAEGSIIAKERNIPDWENQFNKANSNHRAASLINDIAENSAKAASNRNFSMSDNMWGSALMGGNIANAVANPLGALGGAGMAIAHKFARENGNTMLARYGNNIALYLSDMAQKEANNQLGRIPKILKGLAKNTFSSGGVLETGNAVSRFLGTSDKDEQKSYQDLAYRLENANSNNEYAKTLDNGTPNIANAYRQANDNVVSYLNKALPKNPNANMPFADKWKPSKQQLKDLNDKVSVINNPYLVLDRLQNGTINKNHMDALKGVYPHLYNNVVNQVNEYGIKNPNMPYNKKIRLSLLTGTPLDSSIKNVNTYQNLYQQNQSKPIAASKLNNIPGAEYTNVQRINNGLKG